MKAIALVAAAALIASCSRQNTSICEPPKAEDASDYKNCIHRSAYKLAGSPGPNAEIAKAVAAECDAVISRRVLQDITSSTRSGVDWDAYDAQFRKEAEAEALMRVVQARAGHCDVPK